MQSYPIWLEIESCNYKRPKSYGIRKHGTQDIKIGTSKKKSFDFGKLEFTHRQLENGVREYRLSLDGQLLRSATYDPKSDNAPLVR